jgi:hypothetical protein
MMPAGKGVETEMTDAARKPIQPEFRRVTFTGVVFPVEWDCAGRAAEVEIRPNAKHSRPRLVARSRFFHRELLSCLFRRIRVTGVVRRCRKGGRCVEVERFSLA